MAPKKQSATPRDAGVTLIEMMVVLVIIAVIAAMVVPNVIGRPDEARVTVAETDLRSIASALELYRRRPRRCPRTGRPTAISRSRPKTPGATRMSTGRRVRPAITTW